MRFCRDVLNWVFPVTGLIILWPASPSKSLAQQVPATLNQWLKVLKCRINSQRLARSNMQLIKQKLLLLGMQHHQIQNKFVSGTFYTYFILFPACWWRMGRYGKHLGTPWFVTHTQTAPIEKLALARQPGKAHTSLISATRRSGVFVWALPESM